MKRRDAEYASLDSDALHVSTHEWSDGIAAIRNEEANKKLYFQLQAVPSMSIAKMRLNLWQCGRKRSHEDVSLLKDICNDKRLKLEY